jgi:hypothetical protein
MESNQKPIGLKDIFIPSEKVVARDIEGEIIIVPIEDGVADFSDALYSLNETGRRMWELLNGSAPLKIICEHLSEEYNAPIETIQADVTQLIQKLVSMHIIKKIG